MSDGVIFEDIFEAVQKDADASKFDRVSRYICKSDVFEYDLAIDINTDVYPEFQEGVKFTLVLARTLHTDGKGETGQYDRDFPVVSGRPSLLDKYDYVMHGTVYKVNDGDRDAEAGTRRGHRRYEAFVSYGGLLMKLGGDPSKLKVLSVDDKIYLLMRIIGS